MSEQATQEIASETTLQPTAISEPQSDAGIFSFFTCCASSTARKVGGGVASILSGSDGTRKRVLVIGKSSVGKSRILSLLADPNLQIIDDHVYTATDGTSTVQVSVPPISFTFVEVGGSLSDFWARSMDNGIDGVWYLMSKGELESSNYDLLLKFLQASKGSFEGRKKKCLIISVIDVDNTASTSDIIIQVNAAGFVDPHFVAASLISTSTSRDSILPSIELLKSKLVT
jgi:hypothetical protein